MKRFEFNRHLMDKGVDINMSPLIDVVFLLLIFFVVTTVFVEETGIDVQKPSAASARELDKKSILIALAQNGDIVYGGRAITLNAVRGIVAQQLQGSQIPVIILGDTKAQMGVLVDLIDECKLAGAKQVSIAAQREP
jgi:biopolymer transport protein ExbD